MNKKYKPIVGLTYRIFGVIPFYNEAILCKTVCEDEATFEIVESDRSHRIGTILMVPKGTWEDLCETTVDYDNPFTSAFWYILSAMGFFFFIALVLALTFGS